MLTKNQVVGLGWYGRAPSVLLGCGDQSPIKKKGLLVNERRFFRDVRIDSFAGFDRD